DRGHAVDQPLGVLALHRQPVRQIPQRRDVLGDRAGGDGIGVDDRGGLGRRDRLHRGADHLGVVGHLRLFVRHHDRVDEPAVLIGEVPGQVLVCPVRQILHVLGGVGPQRGDRLGGGAGHLHFRGHQRPVREVRLHHRAGETARRDEHHGRRRRRDQPAPARRAVHTRHRPLPGVGGVRGVGGFWAWFRFLHARWEVDRQRRLEFLDGLGGGVVVIHRSGLGAPGALAFPDRYPPGGRRVIRVGAGPRIWCQYTWISLLIFHCCPSSITVTTQRLPLSTVVSPSGMVLLILVATRTSALPSSYQRCTPASSTSPVVGSDCATRITIWFIFSRYMAANSPVPCSR